MTRGSAVAQGVESRPLCSLAEKVANRHRPGKMEQPPRRPDQSLSSPVHPGPKEDSGSQLWLPIGTRPGPSSPAHTQAPPRTNEARIPGAGATVCVL